MTVFLSSKGVVYLTGFLELLGEDMNDSYQDSEDAIYVEESEESA